MPFDSMWTEKPLVAETVGNTLAAVGITPVPRHLADRHKKKVMELYRRESLSKDRLVQAGIARWATLPLMMTDRGTQLYPRSFTPIRRRLGEPVAIRMTPDRSIAPSAIIQVARKVHQQIEKPAFSVEYFYDDPILNVTYYDTVGKKHHDCLGIWDDGKVIAIATLPPPRTGWMRLFDF